MHSVQEIQTWPLARIYHEIDDQKEWIRETRRTAPGFDTFHAQQYLDNLFEGLAIVNARRRRRKRCR